MPACSMSCFTTGTSARPKDLSIGAITAKVRTALGEHRHGDRAGAAAAADPGRRQHRRLHHDGGDEERQLRFPGAAECRRTARRERRDAVQHCQRRLHLQGQRQATAAGGGPDEGGDPRGHRRPGVLRGGNLSRLDLRQSVRQVQQRLPGLRPGRCAVPAAARRCAEAQGQGQQRADGAAGSGRLSHRRGRAAAGDALQSLSRRDRSSAAPRRASAPARR